MNLQQHTNQKKIGILLSYAGMGMNALIQIVYTPVMIRLLGQSEYGLYHLVYSIVGYLGLLGFGFSSAYVRFYAQRKSAGQENAIAQLNGMFLVVLLCISLVACTAGGLLTHSIGWMFRDTLTGPEIETTRVLMAFLTLNLAITFPASLFDCYITAHEQFFFQRIVNLLRTALNPFLALPLLLMGFRSVAMVAVTTALTVASLIVNIWYCRRKLRMRFYFRKLNFALFGEIGVFCFYIFLNEIVNQINWSSDKFLLGMMSGSAAVAVYAVAGTINNIYMQFSTTISSVFIPQVNQMIADHRPGGELTKLFTKVGRVQFAVMMLICSGLIFFGRPFVYFYAGPAYTDCYQVILLLVIPVTIPLIQNLGIEIQRAMNKHKFRSVVYLVIAAANVFVSIPMIHVFGVAGAAFGTALTLLIGNGLVMNIYYHKVIGIDILSFWRQILLLSRGLLIPAVLGGVLCMTVDLYRIPALLLSILLYTLVYGLSMWRFGLCEDEKRMVRESCQAVSRHRRK